MIINRSFNLHVNIMTTERGLKKLMKRTKKEGVLVVETDKSKKLSVDEVSNYSQKMTPHLKGSDVSQEDVLNIEKEMNARAKNWVRILGISEASKNGEDRARSNVVSSSGTPPTIYGLPKDHKKIAEGEEHPGIPLRI